MATKKSTAVKPKKSRAVKLATTPRTRKRTAKEQRSIDKQTARTKKLPSVMHILRRSWALVKENNKLLLGMSVVYLAISVIIVQGINSITSGQNIVHSGTWWDRSFQSLNAIISNNNNNSSDMVSIMQLLMFVIQSLALIWVLRRIIQADSAQERPSLKDAYYKSSTPLVPYVLVLLIVALQSLPLVIGSSLLSLIAAGSSGSLQVALLFGLFCALAAWSAWMLSVSLIALYSVTLPDMTPLAALRATKRIVRFRRTAVIGRLFGLLVCVGLAIIVCMIAVITFIPVIAPLAFYACIALAITYCHVYGYLVYKDLLV